MRQEIKKKRGEINLAVYLSPQSREVAEHAGTNLGGAAAAARRRRRGEPANYPWRRSPAA